MTQQLVLVIDDEEPVRDAVTDILDLEGLSVLTAPDGHAGIDLYRQRQADIGLDPAGPVHARAQRRRDVPRIAPDQRARARVVVVGLQSR